MKQKMVLGVLAIIIVVLGYLFVFRQNTYAPDPVIPSTTQKSVLLIDEITKRLPKAIWTEATATTIEIFGKTIEGFERKGTLTTETATITPFEDVNYLKSQGFIKEENFSADGPGSSTVGYTKKEGTKTQVLLLRYKTQPTSSNQNEPLSFECPCKAEVGIFLSN